MNKEYLDALERLGKLYLPENYNKLQVNEIGEFIIVKEALQRLEAIDNAKPSEALECWRYLSAVTPDWVKLLNDGTNALIPIKQSLIKSQEQEKVLKIIFEKSVDIFRLKKLDFNTFNQLQRSCKLPELTQEEFELLKRYCDEI